MGSQEPPVSLLQLRCSTNWQAIDAFRQFLAVFAKDRFTSHVAERIGTATQELLENAANYCSVTADISYELRHWRAIHKLEVLVGNESVPARIQALTKRIGELRIRPAQQVYEEALRDASSALSVRAMLGLARIRFEAEMELNVAVTGNHVIVIARGAD